MKRFGIDPGYDRLGWACIDMQGSNVVLCDCGVITTNRQASNGERLLAIYDSLFQLLSDHAPDAVTIESLFFSKNTTTAFGVAQSRGIVYLATTQLQLPIMEINPMQVKLAVTGYGKADKKAVEKMVRLQVPNVPRNLLDDAIDAIAIALAGR